MLKLYERSPTRSDRVMWTLGELDMPHDAITGQDIFRHPEVKRLHPMGKIPVADVDGVGLFESAAISTYLADQAPEKNLIAPSGTWERALHDQWVCFALTEMEAWLWSTFRNTNVQTEEKRVPEMYAHNKEAYREGAAALDKTLGEKNYLVGDRFSVTDIIVSFTCQFGQNMDNNDGFDNIGAYLARVKTRPHCPLPH